MSIADEFRAVYPVRLADIRGALLRGADGFDQPQLEARRKEARQLLDLGIVRSSAALDALYTTLCGEQQ